MVHLNPEISSMNKWKSPMSGWVKLNVDASVKEGEPDFAIEMVIRNEHGQFMMGRNRRTASQLSVIEVEAHSVLEALH